MWGVAFEVEARLHGREGEAMQLAEDVYGPFSGQVTSTAKDAFRRWGTEKVAVFLFCWFWTREPPNLFAGFLPQSPLVVCAGQSSKLDRGSWRLCTSAR